MNLYIVKSPNTYWRGYFVAADEAQARDAAHEAGLQHGLVREPEELIVEPWPEIKFATVPDGLKEFVADADRPGQVFFATKSWEWVRP